MTEKLRDGCPQMQQGRVDGTDVDDVANVNVRGGIPVVHRVDIANAATNSVDTVLKHKTRVIDVWVVKTDGAGGLSDTIQVKNGATNVITDAIDNNKADKVVTHALTIDDAYHEVAAGGTLRVTSTKASAANVACTVYVLGIRVA